MAPDAPAEPPSSIEPKHLISRHDRPQHPQHPNPNSSASNVNADAASPSAPRRLKGPTVRRACTACHQGKTRCSESLPCQSCIKRGIQAQCIYPDETPDVATVVASAAASTSTSTTPAQMAANVVPFVVSPAEPHAPVPHLPPPQFYEYKANVNDVPPPQPPPPQPHQSTPSPFRPSKRPRPLTDDEAAAITRNFSRGDFFVGRSAPVRIDPRLPVKLTLGEGDRVHFTVGPEALV